MDLAELTTRALEIREALARHEHASFGRAWSLEEIALGLVGDIGDLAKLIQAHEGVRDIDDAAAKLEHELADVLWSILVIASECRIDIEHAFVRAMEEIERSLRTSN
jgi:NTP pyrophosphatase (non-canonical NTP hydrolase)